MEVSAGGAVKSAEAGPAGTSGWASSAGPASRAAASAARTSASTSARVTASRATTPEAVPWAPATVAITVSRRPRVTPLVVSALPAQRRFAVDSSSTSTTQPSARESSRACSTSSCGVLFCEDISDPPPAAC